jgi:hypothetical protein
MAEADKTKKIEPDKEADPGRPKKAVIPVPVESDLMEKLDSLRRAHPGRIPSRAAVARDLLSEAVERALKGNDEAARFYRNQTTATKPAAKAAPKEG